MSLLLKVLGGALAGIGKGMVAQAQLDWDQQKADLLYQRQVALENLSNEHAKERIAATGQENRITAKTEAGYRGALAAQDDAREIQKIKFTKDLDLRNDTKLEAFRSKNRLTEDQAHQAKAAQIEAEQAGYKISRFEVASDGRMVAFNEKGDAIKVSQPGQFVPQGQAGGSESLDSLRTGGGTTKPQGQARTAPAGDKASALAALGNTYHQAKKNPDAFRAKYPSMFAPDGSLLPLETLKQRVNEYGG